MRNEEAIKLLQKYKEESEEDYYVKRAEALDKAIKALEQEPCEDAISREAVLEGLRTCYDTDTKEYSDGSQWINYEDAVAEMENLPSVTPQPKTGHWIEHFNGNEHIVYCENCKTEYYEDDLCMGGTGAPNFCPICGAKMVEPQESEE